MAVTLSELRRLATVASQATGRHYEIEVAYGQPRLIEIIDERSGTRIDISPRLPRGQLATWLNAFLSGIVAATTRPQKFRLPL